MLRGLNRRGNEESAIEFLDDSVNDAFVGYDKRRSAGKVWEKTTSFWRIRDIVVLDFLSLSLIQGCVGA